MLLGCYFRFSRPHLSLTPAPAVATGSGQAVLSCKHNQTVLLLSTQSQASLLTLRQGHHRDSRHVTTCEGRGKLLMDGSLWINTFPAFSPGWIAYFTRQFISKGGSEKPGTHLCIGFLHIPALLPRPSLLLPESHFSKVLELKSLF